MFAEYIPNNNTTVVATSLELSSCGLCEEGVLFDDAILNSKIQKTNKNLF